MSVGVETVEQIVQRTSGCLIPGSGQGLDGWGFEQPNLVEDVSAHGRWDGAK